MNRSTLMQPLRARWAALAPREQALVRAAVGVVLLALLWTLAFAPALRVLRQADAEHRRLQSQWQQMQRLQAEALALKGQPRASHDEAVRALETATRELLATQAQLAVLGERATVTLRGVAPDALAQWLAQVRVNARVMPAEARLTRSAGADAAPSWDGTLVLVLPPR